MSNRYFAERLNPNFGYFYRLGDTVHQEHTGFQDLEIVETPEMGRVMLLDKITQVAENRDWLYHETMVHPALTAHPNPNNVCVIGAGDGGIMREVLKHNPQQAVQAELDGRVIEVCKEYLPSISDGAFDDPRVRLEIGDGRQYIETAKDVFDTVIMDMTDPFGPSTMLYTQDFFQAIKARLRDDNGTFVMHAESPISRPIAYQQILATLGSVYEHVTVCYIYIQMYAVLWAVAIASDSDAPATISEADIARRLGERNVGPLQVYTPASHHSMQVTYPFIQQLRDAASDLPIITDAAPTFKDEIDINQDDSHLYIHEQEA